MSFVKRVSVVESTQCGKDALFYCLSFWLHFFWGQHKWVFISSEAVHSEIQVLLFWDCCVCVLWSKWIIYRYCYSIIPCVLEIQNSHHRIKKMYVDVIEKCLFKTFVVLNLNRKDQCKLKRYFFFSKKCTYHLRGIETITKRVAVVTVSAQTISWCIIS